MEIEVWESLLFKGGSEELKFFKSAIDIVDVIDSCKKCIYFGHYSSNLPKLRLLDLSSSPKIILHYSIS